MTFSPTQTRAAVWASMALAAGWLLSLLAPVLMPFLLAMAVGYALHPLVERWARRGQRGVRG
mgnify:CR=1 FL=1